MAAPPSTAKLKAAERPFIDMELDSVFAATVEPPPAIILVSGGAFIAAMS